VDGKDFVEEEAWAFGRTNVGPTTNPYILPYFYNRRYLDTQYGIRKDGESFKIGETTTLVYTDSNKTFKGKNLEGRPDCHSY